jgi:hypothetical protein
MPEVGRGSDAIADTDGDGAGKVPNNRKFGKSCEFGYRTI